MCTEFNVQTIRLNNLLVVQILYTQKEKAATYAELEHVFKAPAISL
jgi:hypothetical protein